MNLKLLIFQIFLISGLKAISVDELYESNDHISVLPKGDSSYEFVKLNVPVHLFSDKYDVVYVRKSWIFSLENQREMSKWKNVLENGDEMWRNTKCDTQKKLKIDNKLKLSVGWRAI